MSLKGSSQCLDCCLYDMTIVYLPYDIFIFDHYDYVLFVLGLRNKF